MKKILIVRLSSLGDILLATPLIRTLHKNYHSEIDFVLREEYYDLVRLNPNLHDIFLFERDKEKVKKLTLILRQNKYDTIIDLQNNLRSRMLLYGVPGKVYRFKKLSFRKLLLVKFKINTMKSLPPVPQRYANAIPGLELDLDSLELFTDKNASALLNPGEDTLTSKKYIGLAPGSRHFTKTWPYSYFIELGMILNNAGYSVLLFGGKEDQVLCDTISSQLPGSINLSNNNDILQTSADMRKCELLICNDSGLMHTASASGIPVVSIFGSTVTEFGFAPYRIKNLIFENKSLSCRPCTHIGRAECPLQHFKCMLELTPPKAFETIKALLNS